MPDGGMVKLAIDFENPGQEWWSSGGRELWDALLEAFDNHAVVVDSALAESWLAQAALIPGWEGGAGVFTPSRLCQAGGRGRGRLSRLRREKLSLAC